MYTFPNLIKKIRNEAKLTQSEFAEVLSVSPVLIAMIESGQKEVSKKMVLKLAKKLEVQPSSITPFLFAEKLNNKKISKLEKKLIDFGEKMQDHLINKRAITLKKYAKEKIS